MFAAFDQRSTGRLDVRDRGVETGDLGETKAEMIHTSVDTCHRRFLWVSFTVMRSWLIGVLRNTMWLPSRKALQVRRRACKTSWSARGLGP